MRLLTSIPLAILFSLFVVVASLIVDNNNAWLWFQRSGSVLVLFGASLSYRSVFRMGLHGVGGANTTVTRGRIVSVDDSGPVQKVSIEYDEKTARYLYEAQMDKLAGYLGVPLLLFGTVIWGYGDLTPRVMSWITTLI